LLVLAILYRPHAFLQRCVLDRKAEDSAICALFLLRLPINEIVVVFIGLWAPATRLIFAMNAFARLHVRPLGFRKRPVGAEIDAPSPAIVVVNRHPNMPTQCVVAKGWNKRMPGKQPLCNAPVIAFR